MTVRLSRPDALRPPIGSELPRAARHLEARAAALLRLLDREAAMADLNARWRGREGPTDVLSFSLLEGDHAERRGDLLGDVVIGVEVACRQAADAGHSLDEELLRLLIHGVLHLLGHDHEDDAEARVMQAEEARLRAAIALPDRAAPAR